MIEDLQVELVNGSARLELTWRSRGRARNGFVLAPDGFTGWFGSPDMRLAKAARMGDGAFDDVGRLDARTVSLQGACLADDVVELEGYERQLARLKRAGGDTTITVRYAGQSQTARGRAEVGRFDVVGGNAVAMFHIRLWCSDPRKYGDRRVALYAPGPVAVTNEGSWDAYPVVSVGAMSAMPLGYGIWRGSDCLRVMAPLAQGEWHDVDMRTGYVRKAGVILPGAVHSGPLLTVPPDSPGTTFALAPVQGTGVIAVSFRDTFI